jgi:hypothetical protein
MKKISFYIFITLFLSHGFAAQDGQVEYREFSWTQGNDPKFDPTIDKPLYSKNKGPKILIDIGHHNFLPKYGFLKPFSDLAEADGYQVAFDSASFSKGYLDQYDILIIMSALPFEFGTKNEVTDELTFAWSEIDSVVSWVKEGGSLIVFSEHAPFDQAINPLLNQFGINSSIGYTIDSQNYDKKSGRKSWIVYSKDNELLNVSHNLITGQTPSERVDSVHTYGGSALTGSAYENIFKLSKSAENTQHPTGVGPIGKGDSQCLAGKFGKGKILALGDANGFTAMMFENNEGLSISSGMAEKGYRWKQFVVNSLHWLTEPGE